MRVSPFEDPWDATLAARPRDLRVVRGIRLTKRVGAEDIVVAGGGEVAEEGVERLLVEAHRAAGDIEASADAVAYPGTGKRLVAGERGVSKSDGAAGDVDGAAQAIAAGQVS